MGNLSKLYLTDMIRRECWDDMLIKGRGLVVCESVTFLSYTITAEVVCFYVNMTELH